jgi:hypothetical protein
VNPPLYVLWAFSITIPSNVSGLPLTSPHGRSFAAIRKLFRLSLMRMEHAAQQWHSVASSSKPLLVGIAVRREKVSRKSRRLPEVSGSPRACGVKPVSLAPARATLAPLAAILNYCLKKP